MSIASAGQMFEAFGPIQNKINIYFIMKPNYETTLLQRNHSGNEFIFFKISDTREITLDTLQITSIFRRLSA